jgi:hypothetical protein
MDWATFWASFSLTHPVALLPNSSEMHSVVGFNGMLKIFIGIMGTFILAYTA